MDHDEGDQHIRRVTDPAGARLLAHRVMDPARRVPIICLSTAAYLSAPMLDPEVVRERFGAFAQVWVIAGSDASWALADALPERLDVYGGAARVWWPIPDASNLTPDEHPLFLIYDHDDAERALGRMAYCLLKDRLPQPGTDLDGTVVALTHNGAEIALDAGHRAFAACAHLAHGDIYDPAEAVAVAQRVRVRVGEPGRARGPLVPVSLLPFAPEPWERVGQVYAPGMVIEGVVARLAHYGAFVELLPGARGLLPNGRISSEFVAHPEDHLDIDERVPVRILTLDPVARRAELSMVDVPDDARPVEPASIYPGGPPWLAPVIAEGEVPEDPLPHGPAADTTAGSATPEVSDEPSPEQSISDSVFRSSGSGDKKSDDEGLSGREEVPVEQAVTSLLVEPEVIRDRADAEVEGLAELVSEAEAARRALAEAHHEAEERLASLRARARRLVGEMREDIAAASQQITRLSAGHGQELDQAQRRIAELQEHIDDMRARLDASEVERAELARGREALTERAAAARRRASREQQRAELAQRELDRAIEQLTHIDGDDPARRFLRELHHAWSQLNQLPDDRARFPFREPVLGPDFLASVERTQGLPRQRLIEVCAHVVSNRAWTIEGLELHQLRTSEAGGAPARVRADGASAWRVSLQVKSHSARRLHYWQLPDGTIELSKVGLHDDFTIV